MAIGGLRWIAGIALLAGLCNASASVPGSGWFAALTSAYKESSVKDDGDGITTSTACFDATESPRCEKLAFVKRDDFRRVRFYTPPISKLSQYGSPNYLRSDVVVPNCGLPLYVLRPYYFSKRGWLFMRKVSVLLNGTVVYEHAFDFSSVSRDVENNGVEEYISYIADDRALAAFRKIAKGGKLSIRFSGNKGYATVPKDHVEKFSQDVADALAIYDALTAAISPDLLEACETGK